MDEIGVFTPEQARTLWQDYQTRRQLQPHVSQNYPQRRPVDEVSPHRVFVKNSEAETIPAYACMRITGTEVVGGRTALTVEKPTDIDGEFVFNSQYAIAAGAVGWAYRYGLVVMLGNGVTPTIANAQYRPVVASWTIEEGTGPFVVFGEHNASTDALLGRLASGGTSNIIHGIVNEVLGRGYYTIEIADWSGTTPVTDEVPDICLDATGSTSASGDDNCADIVLPVFESQLTGTAVYVLAYDPESVIVPLELASDCKLVDMGDESALGSASDSSGVTEPVFQILRGYQPHVVAYDKEYECCAVTGEWKLISKKAYIFAGKTCEPAICDVCPPAA